MEMEKFSKFLRELRKEKGLNQEQLANELFVHRTTVVKWETGVAVPLNDTLILLSDYFDVSVDELLNGKRNDNGIDTSNTNKVLRELLRSKTKQTKMLFASTVVIILLVILFLIYYFFTTFGTVKTYMVYGDNGNISMRDGLLISTNDNVYFRPGNFFESDSLELVEDISSVRLFYYKDKKQVEIYNVNYDELLVELSISSLKLKSVIKDKKKLYLDVIYSNDENEVIELNYYEDFKNDNVVSKDEDMLNKDLDINKIEDGRIKRLIKHGFKYDQIYNSYVLEKNNFIYKYSNDLIQVIVNSNFKVIINIDMDFKLLKYMEFKLGAKTNEILIYYCIDNNNDIYQQIYSKYLSKYFSDFMVCD